MGDRTVVVADDDADIRDLVAFKLDNAGFTVVPAADGDEASTWCSSTDPTWRCST